MCSAPLGYLEGRKTQTFLYLNISKVHVSDDGDFH